VPRSKLDVFDARPVVPAKEVVDYLAWPNYPRADPNRLRKPICGNKALDCPFGNPALFGRFTDS